MKQLFNKLTIANYLQFFQVARYAGLFLSGVILAKFGVALPIIGQYEFILFLGGLVSFFWIGGIYQTLLTSYHHESDKKGLLSKTISSQFFLGIISSVIAVLYLLIFDKSLNFGYPTIILIGVYLLLNTLTFFNEHYYLIKENTNKLTLYAIGNFCIQILAITIVVLTVPNSKNFALALVAISLWKTLVLLYNLRFEKINFRFTPDWPFLKACSPLIFGLLISGSADYIDSFLVIHFFGNEAFAIFKYGAKEFPLSLLLANSLSLAMVSQIAKQENQHLALEELKQQSTRLMNVLFPITWIFLLCSKFLYPLIFSATFVQSASIFNIYLLLIISRMIFPQSVILALKRSDIILKTSYWEIAINFVSSIVLMWQFGMIGIAYGTVIAFLSEKVILTYRLKTLGIDFQLYTNISKWFIFTIITIFLYFFVENFCR
ncbi:MAG: lipopolysaccharide biosynthesis protein [Bacteroidota bacterium]